MSGLPPLVRRIRSDPYAQAALGYFVYGGAYLAGAALRLAPERRVDSFGMVPWWAWFVAGALLWLVLPLLILRRWRWLVLPLALGPIGRGLFLAWRQGRAVTAGGGMSVFEAAWAVVALVAGALLIRAGLGEGPPGDFGADGRDPETG